MDIVARLLLNTNDFDKNLDSSKSSVNNFQGGISSMAKSVGSGFLKVAGGIGLVVSAGEGLTKFLNSSQELGDMTARNIAALKGTVDDFFYSLGSGEFSSFLSGLGDIIDKAKEAHNALDQLGNTKISHSYFSAENESKIAASQYVAKNKFAPLEDRVKAFDDWRIGLQSQAEINQTLQYDLVKAITTSVETEIGATKLSVSMDDVRMALKIDVTNPLKRDELKEQYSADYIEYQKRVRKLDAAYQHFDKNGNITDDVKGEYRLKTQEENDKELTRLNEKYREAIVVNAMLNKYTDEELTTIANMAIEYRKLDSALASTSREYNETANEFNNANKAVKGFTAVASLEGYKVYSGNSSPTGGKPTMPTPAPVGSIGVLNEQIAAKNKELINATTAQARIAVQTTINELEARKINLQIETNKGAFAAQYGENKFSQISPSEIAGVLNSGTKKTAGANGTDLSKIKLPKHEPIFNKKDIKLNEDYAESLSAIGGMMGSLSGLFDENTASALQWGTSLLTTISQAIPAIVGMMGVKERDTAITNTNTTAEVANAGSKAMSAHSGIPFVGIALGLAGVAAIIAAMSSMPRYAIGGIVPGTSFTGDKIPALVNSGEMILNGSQQSNLFRLLNSGMSDSLGAKISPFAGSNEIRLSSDIAIKGDTLYLALNNYMKRTGKRL